MVESKKNNSSKIVEYIIEQLRPEHKFSGLSLGHDAFTPLKTFARKHAEKFERENLARTYVVTIDDKQKAYISIVCGEISIEKEDTSLVPDDIGYRYNQYPAVKIARLAVDKSLRQSGIGTTLVDLALGISKDQISPVVGCRFIVVDAKKESVPFYTKYGFTLLDTETNKSRDSPIMFIDLNKI